MNKTVLLNFVNLSPAVRPRLLDFIFYEDFFIWIDKLALKIDSKGNSGAKDSCIWHPLKNTIFHFNVKHDFGTKRCPSYSRAIFMKRFYFYPLKSFHFWGFNVFLNNQELKENVSKNLEQSICRFFDFLTQFVFTTSEMEVDYHQRVNVRVA